MRISIEGAREKELDHIKYGLLNMGFDILQSEDANGFDAVRPEVVTKDEFKQRIVESGNHTAYYGGVVWSRVRRLFTDQSSEVIAEMELPVHFISGNMSTYQPRLPNLLVVDCIVPTADALATNLNEIPRYFGINLRLIQTLRSAAK